MFDLSYIAVRLKDIGSFYFVLLTVLKKNLTKQKIREEITYTKNKYLNFQMSFTSEEGYHFGCSVLLKVYFKILESYKISETGLFKKISNEVINS